MVDHAHITFRISVLMRIGWHTVGGICERVYKELDAADTSRFDGFVNIGIDETSYKKGHKYMTLLSLKNGPDEIYDALKKWMAWAQRCRIKGYLELRAKINITSHHGTKGDPVSAPPESSSRTPSSLSPWRLQRQCPHLPCRCPDTT